MGISPIIPYGSHINFIPCQLRKSHCFELINVIDFQGDNLVIILINGSCNEFAVVVSFEAMDDAGVIQLDMRGQVWLKILNRNVCEAIRNNMTTEVILKQQNMPALCLQFTVPVMKKLLVKHRSHPCLSIVPIIKSKLFASFPLLNVWGRAAFPITKAGSFSLPSAFAVNA